MMNAVVLAALLLAAEPTSPPKLDAQQVKAWREDLRVLAEAIPKHHKNPFHTMTRAQFESAVKSLDARIPSLDRDAIIVEMARIVAMIGDGHTRMDIGVLDSMGYDRMGRDYLGLDPKIGFNQFPIRLYLFRDGIFVQAIAAEHGALAGARVVRIGNASAEEVFEKTKSVVFHDNDMTIRQRAPVVMVMPEVLRNFGFIDDAMKATFVLEKDGVRSNVTLTPLAQNATVQWVDARPADVPAPLWLLQPTDNYWFEYLPDTRTLYFQWNAMRAKPHERSADVFAKVFAVAKEKPVDRFVVDLRLNGGGSTEIVWPLVYGLIRSDELNQRGKLFTIIGRDTFSAAMNLAIYLEKHTQTIFVGEPTGSRPNQYGDTIPVVLPNSGITVHLSFIYWQESGPRDTRRWIGPRIAAEQTSEQYRRGIDPAMEAILRFDAKKKSLGEQLLEAYDANGIKAALERYHAFKAEPVNAYFETDADVQQFARELLRRERFADVVAIMKLDVEAYPLSRNAPVYLGLGAMGIGDRELAIRSFKRAVELNPDNSFAADRLRAAEAMKP